MHPVHQPPHYHVLTLDHYPMRGNQVSKELAEKTEIHQVPPQPGLCPLHLPSLLLLSPPSGWLHQTAYTPTCSDCSRPRLSFLLMFFHLPRLPFLFLVAWLTAPLLQDSDQGCFPEKPSLNFFAKSWLDPF